jgi:uncharacterized membrane protein
MSSAVSEVAVIRGRHPIVWTLATFPIACFTCVLFTDVAYVRTMNFMWSDFSVWLLAVGMAGGVLAVIAGFVSWIARRRAGTRGSAVIVAIGSLLTLAVAFLNSLVHSRDAWTSVMPQGLALSGITVLIMLVTALIASARNRRVVALNYPGVRR